MLIPFNEVYNIVKSHGKEILGILHIGAHDCEERVDYNNMGICDSNIYWIDGNPDKVKYNKERGIEKIYEALIYDTEETVDFNVTVDINAPDCMASSSILPLGVHSNYYPQIIVKETKKMQTTTLNNFIRNNNIPIQKLNFWNLDIQGVELQALKSAEDMLNYADVIYVEVNVQELYKSCALLPELDYYLSSKGFNRVAIKMAEQGWGDALYIRK